MKTKTMECTAQAKKDEYKDALKRLSVAESNFQNADPDFFELANMELTAARLRVDTMRKAVMV